MCISERAVSLESGPGSDCDLGLTLKRKAIFKV